METDDTEDKKKPPTEEEIEQRLKTDPEIQAWLAQYRAESVKGFVKSYSFTISHVLSWWADHKKYKDKLPLQFLEAAEKRIWDIQHKKLFNYFCHFCAGHVRTPEIESLVDFTVWRANIKECRFIAPITRQEIELYQDFLHSEYNVDSYYHTFDFQSYLLDKYGFRKKTKTESSPDADEEDDDYENDYENEDENDDKDDEVSNMPAWYKYYDMRMGTGDLINLPDLRGEKERFYTELCREHNQSVFQVFQREYEATHPPRPVDNRPSMSYYTEGRLEFASLFADKETYRLYKSYVELEENGYDYEKLTDKMHFLQTVEEPLSFEPHDDWREQIKITAHKYKSEQIARALDTVFEDYQMRLNTGIGYARKEGHDTHCVDDNGEPSIYVTNVKKDLLKGRELNGEPADWDF